MLHALALNGSERAPRHQPEGSLSAWRLVLIGEPPSPLGSRYEYSISNYLLTAISGDELQAFSKPWVPNSRP